MNYIYPHKNSEILKLGIRMALYREKKPEKSYIIPDPINVSEAIYQTDLDKWQQSFIAYLKEPEFKGSEKVYYREGQQVESFKYMKHVIDFENIPPMSSEIKGKWQEVEEPYKENGKYSDYSIKNAKTFKEDYTQFQEGLKQGKIIAEI